MKHEGDKAKERPFSYYLPVSEDPDFVKTDDVFLELLIAISKTMGEDSNLSYNEAVAKQSPLLYQGIKAHGWKFSEISASVSDYIDEFPGIVKYLTELLEINAITIKGKVLKSNLPTYEEFIFKLHSKSGNAE